MIQLLPQTLRVLTKSGRKPDRFFVATAFSFLMGTLLGHAGNMGRGGIGAGSSQGPSATGASTSQTATAATLQTAQSVAAAKQGSASLQRLNVAVFVLQSQLAAQAKAQINAQAAVNLTNPQTGLILPTVPDGLATGGLVPQGGLTIPTTVTTPSTDSVTLAAGTALTIPKTLPANEQITVTGAGTGATLTDPGQGTITALSNGVSTTVTPGSTISLTGGGTVTFTGSSVAPQSFSTYPLPAGWSTSNIGGLTQANYTSNSSNLAAVTLTQTAQQAVVKWDSFNVGKNTTLAFDQSAGGTSVGDWVVINEVGNSVTPSQVLGSIEAPGQVYVINQNGILFGGSSQINLHALVASSLAINPTLVSNGLLNNTTDYSYLFSSLQDSSNNLIFTPQSATETVGNGDTSASTGGVTVLAGAQINSPTSSVHVGGKVALIGPTVDNEGVISTPDGQTILAAGLQVGLKAHDSNDPTLRGLDVYLGAATDSTSVADAAGHVTGDAVNGGVIDAPRADVTMTGADVQQNGVINDSTSVSLNGRIDLLADYNSVSDINPLGSPALLVSPSSSGNVTFGANSVTQILPELSSTDTVVGSALAESSIINVQALTIHMAPNSLLLAPAAAIPTGISPTTGNVIVAEDGFGQGLTSGVTFNAGSWVFNGTDNSLLNNSGTIQLDANSAIDVSGSQNVSASVLENIVQAQLLGTQLANSPVQQTGALRGATITIDLSQFGKNADGTNWIGSPIGDLSGYAGLVQHTVGELTANGGTVALSAGNAVTMDPAATIDVSGGEVDYQGADVLTTKVVSNGQIIDISQATPSLIYSGILTGFSQTSAKWGVTESFANAALTPQYEQGYVQGGNAGGLTISSPTISLGSLQANTVVGFRQTQAQASLPTTFGTTSGLSTEQAIFGVPQAGALSLSFTEQVITFGTNTTTISPNPADVVFQPGDGIGSILANPFDGDQIAQVVDLPANLVGTDGFGILSLTDGDGNIAVPAGASLSALPGGAITFTAANIDLQGSLTDNGGSVKITADLTSPYNAMGGLTNRGNITLASGASLDVSGLISNNLSGSSIANEVPQLIAGGTVSLIGNDISLAQGSLINVSGGIYVSASRKQTFGSAGGITIEAGENGALNVAAPNPDDVEFDLGSTLEGFSGLSSGAGSLSIQSPLIQIGGASLLNQDDSPNAVVQEGPGVLGNGTTLWLDKTGSAGDFFSAGGFGTFNLTALGELNRAQNLPSILVAAGTALNPETQSWLASLNGSDVELSSVIMSLASERAPIHLSLNAPGVSNFVSGTPETQGSIVMDTGSSLVTDPLSSVTFNGEAVAVKGNITAPGGTITITGAKDSGTAFFTVSSLQPLPTVDIAGALSTAGTTEYTVNSLGFQTGNVLAGGSISLSGNIVGESTASLNVNGTSGVVDVTPEVAGTDESSTAPDVLTTLDSNGGSITLAGKQELYWDGKLSGLPGGPANTTALGGSLSVASGFYTPPAGGNATSQSPADATLVISAAGPTIQSLGATVLGNVVQGTRSLTDMDGNTIYGYFSAATFNGSGLSALTVGGTVMFTGPVALTADRSIAVGAGGFLIADNSVTLTAPEISLGTALPTPTAQQSQETIGDIFSNAAGQNFFLAPSYGANGVLNVNASELLNVGYVSLQGIGTMNVNQGTAVAGDIRGAGELAVAGNINLTAGQIYPTTDNTFTVAAYLDAAVGSTLSGNIVISSPAGATLPQLPLSAGGILNIYADNITQGGVLRAPIGTINLGAAASTRDLLSSASGFFDQATDITLATGSVTSVSAVDPTTGLGLTIPYGQNINGTEWQDPAGNNITANGNGPLGVPAKTVTLIGQNIADDTKATIDTTGGGDIYAYRFVTGTGGTNDILNTTASLPEGSFAIIPNYSASYAPIDPTAGYTAGSNLSVGDRIYLKASNGLPAGYYTLLPSRYALLPGAFLVTPKTTSLQSGTVVDTDGASLVAGFRYSGLTGQQPVTPASGYTTFEVASETVVRARAEYDNSSGNTFLSQSATAQNQPVPRLPVDAGQVVFNSSQALTFNGTLLGQPGTGGQGSLVDISSSSNILINGTGTDAGFTGLVLGTDQLNALNAGSLLIGGTRAANGTNVTVATSSIEVDDSSAPLIGNDLILASKDALTLDANAEIESAASTVSTAAPSLIVSGDGALLRVSSSQGAVTTRTNVNIADATPLLSIGTGVQIEGSGSTATSSVPVGTLTINSSAGISLASDVTLDGDALNFSGGLISIVFQDYTGAGNVAPTNGLVLSSENVAALQQSAKSLSLLSYSSIDLYGDGTLGADSTGAAVIQNLSLQAAELRGFAASPNASNATLLPTSAQQGVTFDATQGITLENSAGSILAPVGTDPAAMAGQISFNAPLIQLGGGTGAGAENTLAIKGFGQMNVNATTDVSVGSSASVTNADTTVTNGQATLELVGANLVVTTPLITGVSASSEVINDVGGDVNLVASGTANTTLAQGLGGALEIDANQINDSGTIILHSGQVTLKAVGTAAGDTDVAVNGSIDVSGVSPTFQNLTVKKYTSGGQVSLSSAKGNASLGAQSAINVSAASGAGTTDSLAANAGTLSVSAAAGTFSVAAGAQFQGHGGVVTSGTAASVLSQGLNGNFNLDVASINATAATSDLTPLEQVLAANGFTQSQTIRIRSGDVVAIDSGSTLTAQSFSLSADAGSITVNGEINASGVTGGSITLNASGSVNLASTSLLTVEGQTFNDAGQGGSVSLNAGSYVGGTPVATSEVSAEGEINLTVDYLPVVLGSTGNSITITNPGTTINGGTFYLPNGTPGNDTLQITGATGGMITTNGVTTSFTGTTLSGIPAGSHVTLNNPAATVAFASGTGGAVLIYLASDANFTDSNATTLTGGAALPAAMAGDVSGTLLIAGPALDMNGVAIPVNGSGTPVSVAVGPLTGAIDHASSIVIEASQVYQPASGVIDNVEDQIAQNSAALVTATNTSIFLTSLFGTNTNAATYAALTTVEPGAVIINPTGDLTLQNTWDLSATSSSGGSFHFAVPGGSGTTLPGILTLRAEGNLVLDAGASLTDGFNSAASIDGNAADLWEAPLMASGTRSWTYNLVAGADTLAANPLQVSNDVGTTNGKLELGLGSANVDTTAIDNNDGSSSTPSSAALLSQFYQTIRTGTGNINISAGSDVQLLNALVTIYTAGTQLANPTSVLSPNDFAVPILTFPKTASLGVSAQTTPYPAQYSMEGGNVAISAQGDIAHLTSSTQNDSNLVADSSLELPTSWLDRRGFTQNGVFAASRSGVAGAGEIASTSWWIDFSNFFEGVGALGGGNVTLTAGGNISNVDAFTPTTARMPGLQGGVAIAPNANSLDELGGGDLTVQAGNNIDAGVYYVERGQGTLTAGNSILTNATRAAVTQSALVEDDATTGPDPSTWLPTTLFLGKGSFNVTATNNVLLGPLANPFLLPQGIDNSFFDKTYFSTYGANDAVNVSSLNGDVTLKDSTLTGIGSLQGWYENVLLYFNNTNAGDLSWSYYEPWLRLTEAIDLSSGPDPFSTAYTIMPGTLRATAFGGDINVLSSSTLSPSPDGTIDLVAGGSINGLQPDVVANAFGTASVNNPVVWNSATINLSDTNPAAIPGIADPLSLSAPTKVRSGGLFISTSATLLSNLNALFAVTGSTNGLLSTKQALHADINGQTLHAGDNDPIQLYAGTGNISGVTLYSGKAADVTAGQDITDIAFYLQNNNSDDISLITAGRDIIPFDVTSPLRVELQNEQPLNNVLPLAGDIQIGGPGTLEVLAGRNFNLGVPSASLQQNYSAGGVGFGLTSIGNQANPTISSFLSGADIVAASSLSDASSSGFVPPDYSTFISQYLTPGTAFADRYLPDLGDLLGLDNASDAAVSMAFNALPLAQQDTLALTIFYDVLRDAGRDHTSLGTSYTAGTEAVAALFPGDAGSGDITLTSREIKTESGGSISLLAPGGQITVGLPISGGQPLDQGVLTVDGGNISIFTNGDVNVGVSRIFTLHGGNEIIWSSNGNIAAGASSKTVQSAPPTRVLVDVQSGNVETDLAGLATGGGIGVLETVAGAPPADVDLIAPKGFVDAGDAGIRASGNLNIAAVQVLNASNISVGGKSSGVPAGASAPNIAGLSAASGAAGAANSTANEVARNNQPPAQQNTDLPDIFTVEVLGYGGGDSD